MKAIEPSQKRRMAAMGLVTVALLMGLLLTALLYTYMTRIAVEREQALFERNAEERLGDLANTITLTLDNLEVVSAFFDAQPTVDRKQFHQLVASILMRHRSIQALEWIPVVRSNQRGEYEALAHSDGLRDFSFKERLGDGALIQAAQRSDYYPVYYVEPLQGNERAVGFDLGSDPTRRAALMQAAVSGDLVATARVTLVQDAENQYGFLVFRPVYDMERADRQVRGFTLGVFRLRALVESFAAADLSEPNSLKIRIVDRSAPSDKMLLYPKSAEGHADDSTATPFRMSRAIIVAGRQWDITIYRPAALSMPHEISIILGMVMLLSLLIAGYAYQMLRSRWLMADQLCIEAAHRAQLQDITDSLAEGVVVLDRKGVVRFINRSATLLLGGGWLGRPLESLTVHAAPGGKPPPSFTPWLAVAVDEQPCQGDDVEFLLPSGQRMAVAYTCLPMRGDGGENLVVLSFRDIGELKLAERENMQSARMASVGQLAAGIAHEINTPVQYIGDNLRYVQSAVADLLKGSGALPSDLVEEYVEELPKALVESIDGVGQIGRIVRSMKEFSHPGISVKTPTDINRSIETSLTVSRNVWRHVAEVECCLDNALPLFLCHAGEMNQVFLNLIVNAAQAIEEAGKPLPGRMRIQTAVENGMLVVSVADSGTGVPYEIRDRICDPFFTTKPVGKGTGQGLAISRDVVVTKHGGRLEIGESDLGGALFVIRLPIVDIEHGEA